MKKQILLASLLMIAACGPSKMGTNPSAMQESEHIILTDRVHKMWLKLVKSKIEKLPSGQSQVTLEIENRKDDDIPTDIQVIYRGADGFEVEKSSWTPYLFHRREVSTFQATSMTSNAADYRVIIGKPNN